jgi:predicted enzyme related to lactoylglutathione lyase
MTYIAVTDVDAACSTAGKSGGAVLKAPFDVPGVGRIAMIKDPAGAVVGLITPAQQG